MPAGKIITARTIDLSNSYAAPNIFSTSFSSGSFPAGMSQPFGAPASLDEASTTCHIVTTAHPASGGGSSYNARRVAPIAVSRYGVNQFYADFGSGATTYDEYYWYVEVSYDAIFNGQMKGLRFVGAAGTDMGGLFVQGEPEGGGYCHLCCSFAEQGGVSYGLGIWLGARNPDSVFNVIPTAATGWADGSYHKLLIHLQRNNGVTNPRYRFWIDGSPLRPTLGNASYHWGESTATASWVDGGVGNPHWLTVSTKDFTDKISQIRIYDQMSHGNTVATNFDYANMAASTAMINPNGWYT